MIWLCRSYLDPGVDRALSRVGAEGTEEPTAVGVPEGEAGTVADADAEVDGDGDAGAREDAAAGVPGSQSPRADRQTRRVASRTVTACPVSRTRSARSSVLTRPVRADAWNPVRTPDLPSRADQ